MAIRVRQAAKILGLSEKTVRTWTDQGKIPSMKNAAGHRTYQESDLQKILREKNNLPEQEKNTVFYIRSSSGDDVSMENQVTELTEQYGEPNKIYRDKASGLREDRKGLSSLMEDVKKGDIGTICITHKDRLARFGVKYLEKYFQVFGTTVSVLHETEQKEPYSVLMDDFMALVTSFAGRFYGMRSSKNKSRLLDNASQEIKHA